MSRWHTNTVTGSPFIIKMTKPIDDRLVVDTRDSLLNTSTFSGRGIYDGMIVAVVDDEENNGIYMLPDRTMSTKQSWDETDTTTFNKFGWMSINGTVIINNYNGESGIDLDTSTDNESDLPGSFAQKDGKYYVSTINGGEF